MLEAEVHSNKDLWETPEHIFRRLDQMYDFDLDPCCTIESAKCSFFYTPKEDGLSIKWHGETAFVNPPYSRGNIDKWVYKCYLEAIEGVQVIALLPVSTSADWFQKFCLGNTIYWVDKRIRFVGAKYTAPFSSMIVDFNRKNVNKRFYQ